MKIIKELNMKATIQNKFIAKYHQHLGRESQPSILMQSKSF